MIVLCGVTAIEAEQRLENDQSLFFRILMYRPNSFLVDVNVAAMLVNNADDQKDSIKRNNDLHRRGTAQQGNKYAKQLCAGLYEQERSLLKLIIPTV